MEWCMKQAPLYVWPGDVWIKKPDFSVWDANVERRVWMLRKNMTIEIPFPQAAKVWQYERYNSIEGASNE